MHTIHAIHQVVPYSKPYSNTAKKLLYAAVWRPYSCTHIRFWLLYDTAYSNFSIQQPYSIQQPRPSLWKVSAAPVTARPVGGSVGDVGAGWINSCVGTTPSVRGPWRSVFAVRVTGLGIGESKEQIAVGTSTVSRPTWGYHGQCLRFPGIPVGNPTFR